MTHDEPIDDAAWPATDDGLDRDRAVWWRRPVVGAVALLAVLAYVPTLSTSPGRMPADSKLYLYLDPGRLIADALGTYDPRQFAGWVPHQHISFVWPSGPWFWLFEQLGSPDWIAHRLWVGTLLLAAGLGVRWCALQVGLSPLPALVGAVAYELAPYLLPYVSRTSVMLLPWAGLGWIVALTIRATRRPGWRDPALIALVVLTVGAVNATALAMIVPAPAVWLIHAVWGRWCSWRAAVMVAARTALLSAGVSLWWIAALVVQGRYGADVLPYSESLADVSYTATSAEVWRGLGYWLFYIRDPYGATTTASLRYLTSSSAILVSFLVPVLALVSLVWVRWAHRRFALLLVAAGVVLAVGVHPIDDRSPLMTILTGDGEEGLALALRSSTRALPVLNLGLALALGSLVGAVAHLQWRRRRVDRVLAVGVVGLVLLNVPSIWSGAFVDPALERDQDPPDAWIDAAAALDAAGDGRVLMLPGTEFGAYRWGYTVDQPLPGLTERALVTRDLLPLGSPAAMDLWFAYDDRVQDGVAEPESLQTIARLFGADVVWLTNDVAFDRFRLARPEVVRELVLASDAVVAVDAFGEPVVNVPEFAMLDPTALAAEVVGDAAPPVELVVLDTEGAIARAYDRTLLVAASGDGVVDIAASGLLPDGVGLRYSADDPSHWPSDVGTVVTDSNRDRARHWRSSQDTRGFTETGGDEQGVLDPVAADARLPVFDDPGVGDETVAVQRGPVVAEASSYGEPFAYVPEHRAAMAVDGDPTTAWITGEHGDPIGERLRLSFPDGSPSGQLELLQPVDGPGHRSSEAVRRISRISLVEGDGELDESTRREIVIDPATEGWSTPIALTDGTTVVEIEILAVSGGEPFTPGIVAGVGFAEVDLGLDPTTEVVVPPAVPASVTSETPLGWVLTRWRTDPLDPWRSDPEPVMIRELDVPDDRAVTPSYTVRVDRRADDATLAALFDWPVVADNRLVGSIADAGVAAFDGDLTTTWTSDFDRAVGSTLTVSSTSQPVDRLVLTQPVAHLSRITEIEVSGGGVVERVRVEPDADGTAVIDLPRSVPAGELTIEVTAIDPVVTIDRRFGDPFVTPVAVGEIVFDGAPSVRPLDEFGWTSECVVVATVDGDPIEATLTIGDAGWLDGDPIEATPCDDRIDLTAGVHLVVSADGPFQLDRLVLDDGVRIAVERDAPSPEVTTDDAGRYGGTYTVTGCDQGCWFVDGAGYNEAWTATIGGDVAGTPALLDGGFNGWWIPPTDAPVTVEVSWTAQTTLTVALVLTLAAALACLAIVGVASRRHSAGSRPERAVVRLASSEVPLRGGGLVFGAAVWVLSSWLLIGPWGLVWGALAAGALALSRNRLLPALTAVATVAAMGGYVLIVERNGMFPPDGGWPARFEAVHSFGMFAVACVVTAAVVADDARRTDEPSGGRAGEPPVHDAAALPSEP
ncbi:MAG: hypothetical protein CL424_06055 [Acidimicrobiaceae bacterium]|nr:hypothetical protein [Acidimicrobiaceae bacterium]